MKLRTDQNFVGLILKTSLALFLKIIFAGQNEWEIARGQNRQFQLLVYVCSGRWEVSYHIADYAEK